MKTETEIKKNKHTQGKWRQSTANPERIFCGQEIIADTKRSKKINREEAKANATRIVKAVNLLCEIENNLEWLNKTGAISENEKLIKREYLKLLQYTELK